MYPFSIIYNPKASDNEEKSAELFETFARECCLDAEKSDKIKEWILLTKSHTTDAHTTHGVYGSEDKHYLLDFDMAVLGWPQDGRYPVYGLAFPFHFLGYTVEGSSLSWLILHSVCMHCLGHCYVDSYSYNLVLHQSYY